MYHLLVSYDGWSKSNGSIDLSRAFEYTEDRLRQFFRSNGAFNIAQISQFPALFASESGGSGEQLARVGYINHITTTGREINLRYLIDLSVPALSNEKLKQLSFDLGIQPHELSRTHWAIKDVDLFKVLYENHLENIFSPKIFSIESARQVEGDLMSVMMPFSPEFDDVYKAIRQTASAVSIRCLRVKDIWEENIIIQDIVSLICRSKIVICDCTDRNPNVFYEAGIAHVLGKDVIIIAQNERDIPFNIGHLRYLKYLDNNEGRERLTAELLDRVSTILSSRSAHK